MWQEDVSQYAYELWNTVYLESLYYIVELSFVGYRVKNAALQSTQLET
jgi:hypothetical protein